MKLWDKGYTVNNLVDKFTVGNDRILDLKIAKHDVLGNMAHAKMLNKINFLSDKELSDILGVLNDILQEIETGTFTIEEDFEDVHSKIEYELTKRIGEAGKKIATGRSRNDYEVTTDVLLFYKNKLEKAKTLVEEICTALQDKAEKYSDAKMPGFTHMQKAMPSTPGDGCVRWHRLFGKHYLFLLDTIQIP